MSETISLEHGAIHIIDRLTKEGYQTVMVGGYVRDRLLGKTGKDIDLATSAAPETVLTLFPHVIPTGLQHGTVTVLINRIPYEVTTFRSEQSYVDHRRPERVDFVNDLQEDLLRRDFTINAMALNADGSVIDPFCGQQDLGDGIIRCVGVATERFGEDALRMLRAIRFASRLGFEIESSTWDALLVLSPTMEHIAMERIRSEWELMLQGDDPKRAIDILAVSRLLESTREPLPYRFQWTPRMQQVVVYINALTPGLVRWLAWAWGTELDEPALRSQLHRMTCSRNQTHEILRAFRALSVWAVESSVDVKKMWQVSIVRYGKSSMKAVHQLMISFQNTNAESLARLGVYCSEQHIAQIVDDAAKWADQVIVEQAKDLVCNGATISGWFDRPAGPWLSLLIQAMVEAAACGEVSNELTDLREFACQWMKENGHADRV